jgi:hypothetical protein
MGQPSQRVPSDHVQIAGRSDLDLEYAAALSAEQRDEPLRSAWQHDGRP